MPLKDKYNQDIPDEINAPALMEYAKQSFIQLFNGFVSDNLTGLDSFASRSLMRKLTEKADSVRGHAPVPPMTEADIKSVDVMHASYRVGVGICQIDLVTSRTDFMIATLGDHNVTDAQGANEASYTLEWMNMSMPETQPVVQEVASEPLPTVCEACGAKMDPNHPNICPFCRKVYGQAPQNQAPTPANSPMAGWELNDIFASAH